VAVANIESRLYFAFVRAMVLVGVVMLLIGFSQPLALLVVWSSTSGLVMVVYSTASAARCKSSDGWLW
jgi:hypothetical protein